MGGSSLALESLDTCTDHSWGPPADLRSLCSAAPPSSEFSPANPSFHGLRPSAPFPHLSESTGLCVCVPSPMPWWGLPRAGSCFSGRARLIWLTVYWDLCPFFLRTSLLKLLFHTFDCFLGYFRRKGKSDPCYSILARSGMFLNH